MSAESFIQVMRGLIAKEVSALLPAWRWGTVTNLSPLTVELDAEQGTLTHIGSTVGGLTSGDRVEIRTWRSRSLITGRAGGASRAVLAGSVVITPTAADTVTTVTVPLPAGAFAVPPVVTVTANTAVPHTVAVGVGTPTVDGFTINFHRSSAAATTVYWMAVEPA